MYGKLFGRKRRGFVVGRAVLHDTRVNQIKFSDSTPPPTVRSPHNFYFFFFCCPVLISKTFFFSSLAPLTFERISVSRPLSRRRPTPRRDFLGIPEDVLYKKKKRDQSIFERDGGGDHTYTRLYAYIVFMAYILCVG